VRIGSVDVSMAVENPEVHTTLRWRVGAAAALSYMNCRVCVIIQTVTKRYRIV